MNGCISAVACSGQAITVEILYEAVFPQLAIILHVAFGIGRSSSDSTVGQAKDFWKISSQVLKSPTDVGASMSELTNRQGKTNISLKTSGLMLKNVGPG